MADSVNVFPPSLRVTDADGNPVAGAKLKFFEAGTSTPLPVYSDDALTAALGTVVHCDSAGYPVTTEGGSTKTLIYAGTTDYKLTITDADDVTIAEHDDNPGALDTSGFAVTSAAPSMPVVTRATSSWSVASDAPGTLYRCNVAGSSQTVSFPSAVTAGDGYLFGLQYDGPASANTVTFQTVSGQTIADGADADAASGTLTEHGQNKWFVADGAGWRVAFAKHGRLDRGLVIVIADRLTAPPSSPTAGARYIISGTPTSTWAALGFSEHDIVEANGQGGWIQYTPETDCGWLAYVQDENLTYQYAGTEWVAWSNITAPAQSFMRRFLVENQQAQNTNGGNSTANTWHDRTLNTVVLNTLTAANGTASDAALATDVMTVPAGSYDVIFAAPVFCVAFSRTRLISSTEMDSGSSHAVGSGSKSFTVAADLAFAAGQEVRIYSSGTTSRIMEGLVTAYSGTTLTVNVTRTSGSGTSTDWKIAIVVYGHSNSAGEVGATNIMAENVCRRSITLAAEHAFKLQSYTDATQATYGLGYAANIPGAAERYGFVEWLDVQSLKGPQGDQGAQGSTGRDAGHWRYTFSTADTAETDPGSGAFKLDNATVASVTELYISATDADSGDADPFWPTVDDSTSSIKGQLVFRKANTPGTSLILDVDGTVTDNTGWWTVPVAYNSGALPSNADSMLLTFVPTGDAGVTTAGVVFDFDGGASVIEADQKARVHVPFACTIQEATLVADTTGSIVIDVWKDTYANYPPTVADTITAAAKPTLSSAQKYQDATLTGWTTSIAAGDVLIANVDSASGINNAILTLKVQRS